MTRERNPRRSLVALLAATLLASSASPAAAAGNGDMSSGTTSVVLYIDNKEAFLNGAEVTLDQAPVVLQGKTFVPAKFLGDALGMKVEWEEKTRTAYLETPTALIRLDTLNKSAWVNDYWYKLDQVAAIVNGKLLVKLTWLSDYMGAKYTYNPELHRIDVLHVNKPAGAYDPATDNSRPVAKFMLGKGSYKIGEPIKYVNLSYDPDAEALKLEWEGKEEAFFEPGTHPVTLVATDKSGNKSAPFTRNVVIEDDTYLSEVEYPIYTKPIGSYMTTDWSSLYLNFFKLAQLQKQVSEDRSRSLLVSDSPETFKETGILYQDTVTGKTRLYANHQNGTPNKVSFAILATNESDRPVTVATTRQGEVYPTIYAMQMGSEASVDFLMNDPVDERMTIPPGETYVYKQFPDFYPGQGVNLLYDVDSDGPVQYTFAVSDAVSADMIDLPKLAFNGHIRGTFPITGFDWKVDLTAKGLDQPKLLIVGDGKTDAFQKGVDPLRGTEAIDSGNYGTVYRIHADRPRKMAILVLARGGAFKGPFKIDGEIRKVPGSGVLTAYDGMVILHKTTGKEASLDIEFTPPAGSAFPINLIFYPLDERAN
ncbi:copper amine oxidase N-terminal domain-containing protein [Cohnella sp. GCM10027633]|uniref:copper amine oxidase N-terminal domain-containing protein n=1 Tax=unclassified Cohnella TaxID=2636738 RepID=UPI00364192B1